MSAGIQILNDYGTILIDQNYSNLVVRKSGTAVVDTLGVINPTITSDWAVSNPLLAVGGNHTFSGIGVYMNGSVANGFGSMEGTGSWSSVPYWFFDVPSQTASSYGLIVKNASGQIVFDAAQKNARVVDVRIGPSYDQNNGVTTYPAGRTYAICILKSGGKSWYHTVVQEQPDGSFADGTITERWNTIFTLNGNTLNVSNRYTTSAFDINGGKGHSDWRYSLKWAVAVLDVTGY